LVTGMHQTGWENKFINLIEEAGHGEYSLTIHKTPVIGIQIPVDPACLRIIILHLVVDGFCLIWTRYLYHIQGESCIEIFVVWYGLLLQRMRQRMLKQPGLFY